jgi:DNA-binding transcriptional LysR family regulator
MSQPTLGRQVAALEQELGVALFERGNKGLELTPSGRDLLQCVRNMGEAASNLSLAASGQSDALEGRITISATEVVAALVLPNIVHRLRQQQPGIAVDIIASNDTSDLRRREADIAIRAFRPTQPDLIARKLSDLRAGLYATPDYVASLGSDIRRDSLMQARFIGFCSYSDEYLKGLNEQGLVVTDSQFIARSDNHLVHWELTKHGLGIGVMPTDIGDREPSVVRVLEDTDVYRGEVWLVAHREVRMSRRVRTVYDFLADALAC